MNKFLDKQNIMIELSETENLLNLTGDHPLMSIGLNQKIEKLRAALMELNDDFFNPTISFLFSGKAVNGSIGIKSSFLAKILNPIQDMIKTQTAELKFNRSSKRGKVKGNKEKYYSKPECESSTDYCCVKRQGWGWQDEFSGKPSYYFGSAG